MVVCGLVIPEKMGLRIASGCCFCIYTDLSVCHSSDGPLIGHELDAGWQGRLVCIPVLIWVFLSTNYT